MDASSSSIFDRLISRKRHPWVIAGISLFLMLVPISIAYLEGILNDFFSHGHWRMMLQPVIITYALVIYPLLGRLDKGVLRAFRPLVLLDDDSFNHLVAEASRINPLGKVIAFGIGMIIGFLLNESWIAGVDTFWLRSYLSLSYSLMFGVLGWAVYGIFAGTKLMTELHRQPLDVDIFDLEPFEPIGRQSLILALAFVGGTTLSMFFISAPQDIVSPQGLIIYIALAAATVLVFFLNMRHSHRVLATVRKQELRAVERNISIAHRTLKELRAQNGDTSMIAAELNAWIACEQRLKATKTWPYNTDMLRTLFFSVFVPGSAALARIVAGVFFDIDL